VDDRAQRARVGRDELRPALDVRDRIAVGGVGPEGGAREHRLVSGEPAVVDHELGVGTGVGDRQRTVDERLPAHPLGETLQAAAQNAPPLHDVETFGVADVLVRGLKPHPLLRVDAVHLFELRHLDEGLSALCDGHLDECRHRVRGLELADPEGVGTTHIHPGHARGQVAQRSDGRPKGRGLLQSRVHFLVDDGGQHCLVVDVESGHLAVHLLSRRTRRWTETPSRPLCRSRSR
jgi:hypothetical protein